VRKLFDPAECAAGITAGKLVVDDESSPGTCSAETDTELNAGKYRRAIAESIETKRIFFITMTIAISVCKEPVRLFERALQRIGAAWPLLPLI
jgi:hypothetical protein